MEKKGFSYIDRDESFYVTSVAEKCYQIAKEMGEAESFARRMYVIGFNHLIGKRFSKNNNEIPQNTEILLRLLGVPSDSRLAKKTLHSISNVLKKSEIQTREWEILNLAILTTDDDGSTITAEKKLNKIGERYGVLSEEYVNASAVCSYLDLI